MCSQTQLTRPGTGGWLNSPVYLGQLSEPLLHDNELSQVTHGKTGFLKFVCGKQMW